jgi:hypothetical protein
MVHIANAGLGQGPMFFNVDNPVGAGPGTKANRTDDVQMVQMFLSWLGYYKGVVGNDGGFSGQNDQNTIDAIKAFQKAKGLVADGRISVARGTSFGSNTFTIVELNKSARQQVAAHWPRIHCVPGKVCAPLVYAAMERVLGVSYSMS